MRLLAPQHTIIYNLDKTPTVLLLLLWDLPDRETHLRGASSRVVSGVIGRRLSSRQARVVSGLARDGSRAAGFEVCQLFLYFFRELLANCNHVGRVHVSGQRTQIPNSVPQHLVLPRQHLRLGLVKGALVATGQRQRLATVLADGRGSQSR